MAADRAEIERLIRAADAAGDADAVGVLFGELDKIGKLAKSAITPPPAPTQQPFPDVYGGAGGFNPMLPRIGGAADAVAKSVGVQPGANMGAANAAGPAEMAAHMGTGALATPIAGLAGLGQGIKNRFSPGMPAADRIAQVQEGLTYQPRTAVGQGMTNVLTSPFQAAAKGTNYLGEKTAEVTGSPALGAAVKTAGDLAPALLTRGEVSRPTPGLNGKYVPTKGVIPTTEELTAASKRAYAAGKESGVMVSKEGYEGALAKVRQMATDEGVDPTLHPKSSAVLKRLEESAGKDLTLQEAETLRKIAMDAEDDLNPVTRAPTPDARIAAKLVDELDDSIDALSTNAPARALWARSRRSQMIDQMIHRAEIKAGAHYTQAGMEHALRQEFKQLALNPRRMRGLTIDQKAAIEKVAKGGPMENTLRTLGKFDPTTGGVAAAASIGTGMGLSGLTGGGSMALPLIGFGSRRLATRATAKNVDAAREALVGRGPATVSPLSTAAPKPLIAAPQTARASTTVRTPENIRKEMGELLNRAGAIPRGVARDAPQVKALWADMERLQAELTLAESRAAVQP